MQTTRYNPLLELQRMEHNLDKLWGNWNTPGGLADTAPLDLYEENGNLIAEIGLPHFAKDEVQVTSDNGALEIMADHKESQEKQGARRYFVQESTDQYFRHIVLPENVVADKAKAHFKDGMLRVIMPLASPRKPTSVTIT